MTTPKLRPRRRTLSRAGIGIDAYGEDAYDPSENVKALNDAANKRQDDLRGYSERLMMSEIARLDSHVVHLKEMGKLRADHSTEVRLMETERLDSIRQVDVLARNTAADRASDAIQALAATTQTNAENLRTALANTATTIAKQTSDTAAATAKATGDTFEALAKRIASLEASAYRGEGREKFADPQMEKLLSVVNQLSLDTRQGTGKTEGFGAAWAMVAVLATLFISVAGITIAFTVANRGAASPQVTYAPPVALVPAPRP